ncbi:hypothetical protein UY3_13990 [Chelonia mydas]|uniref:Uncharacterized protein n=1 Tax=Chelonia mydas TaxID=8469 RepID=M7B0N1_CHEMY|nr:hypothetical protein UY3_13990 [Chelonia mydas]
MCTSCTLIAALKYTAQSIPIAGNGELRIAKGIRAIGDKAHHTRFSHYSKKGSSRAYWNLQQLTTSSTTAMSLPRYFVLMLTLHIPMPVESLPKNDAAHHPPIMNVENVLLNMKAKPQEFV